MTTKNSFYLWGTILFLILLNFSLIVRIDSYHNYGKRFTYTDGVALYKICNKKPWNKDSMINRLYWEKNTDFKEFLQGK